MTEETTETQDRNWREVAADWLLALPNLVKLLYRLLRDPRVPVRRKVVAGGVLAYVVSPLDVIPDVIPIVGRVDDVILVAFAVSRLIDSVEPEVVTELWDGSGDVYEIVADILRFGAELLPGPVRRLLD